MDLCKKAFDQRRYKEILSKCADAVAENPQSADPAVMLAKTEFDRGRVVQALDWAKKAIAADADRADAYVFLGGAEQAAGHNAAAKAAYKRYLQLAPQGRYAGDLRSVLSTL
jgi:tetratricopeptide (TPR) repeat protein